MPPKPYAVFYHVWCPAGTDIWRLLVDEQLKRIRRSGLVANADVYCCISGPQHAVIRDFIAAWSWVKIIRSLEDESNFEGETLSELYRACFERDDLKAVAYIHTKGIRHFAGATPNNLKAINSWRHFLEWGTVDRWRDAIARLDAHDVVGVNYRVSPWPHFSGNFWWAKPAYIRLLPPPEEHPLLDVADVAVDTTTLRRLDYEKWVGVGAPKAFSFRDFPFDIPGQDWTYGFSLYEDDIYPFYERDCL